MKNVLTRHYLEARRINSVLKVFGSLLLNATSTGVYRALPAGSLDCGYTNTCAAGERDCPHGEQPNTDLSGSPINVSNAYVSQGRNKSGVVVGASAGDGLLIGTFSLADDRIALLLHNQNWDMGIWPTIEFKNLDPTTVLEVDPVTGSQAIVLDDSPEEALWNPEVANTSGLQLGFGAAQARLLVLPRMQ